MIDQRSPTWFSTGVPVSAIRHPAGSDRAACACLVCGFLMFCASSRITPAQADVLRAGRGPQAQVP